MTNQHASDCAVHNEPAYPAGPCDCHLSIESRLDQMIKHAYQGSTEAADEIRQELVERYKAMQPAKMQPCAGRNCGSTDPNLHSAECFEDYEKATGMNRQEPVAYWDKNAEVFCMPPKDGTRPFAKSWKPLYTAPPAPQREWQGLTIVEIRAITHETVSDVTTAEAVMFRAFARAIEAKLKEKNNG